jgi:hypothetical protein
MDGLLDTGSDRILLTPKSARNLGIDVNALSDTVEMQSATRQTVTCRTTHLPVELIRDSVKLCWLAEVAIAIDGIRINHWGFTGFLEFFRAEFDGPNRVATLIAGANLPVIEPPT